MRALDCFKYMDWNVFREAATINQHINLKESVTGFISKCVEDVTVNRNIITHANQKLWLTREVHALLRACNTAFKPGDRDAVRSTRPNLNLGERAAKRAYGHNIHSHFTESKRLWHGIQSIKDYKPSPSAYDDNTDFLNTLNKYFSQFEENNNTTAIKAHLTMKYSVLQCQFACAVNLRTARLIVLCIERALGQSQSNAFSSVRIVHRPRTLPNHAADYCSKPEGTY